MACGGADILQLLAGSSPALDLVRLKATRTMLRATTRSEPNQDERRAQLALSMLGVTPP